ncbi:MAG TPA: hypothetical protein VHW71_18690 [Steroidobacteraceae bacterium]|jgi:hypothetical protein|nr:hypothetical protein [Steroidobacteraceae bacterium]
MSFAERAMRFTFSGAQAGSFSAAGLRAAVSIQAFPGRQGSNAQVKIWGLTLEQMTTYSSKMPRVPGLARGGIEVELFNLIIEAGDLGGNLSEILNGPVFSSYIDLSGAPDSAFNVTIMDIHEAATPRAAQSQPGAQKAEDLIANVCASAGLKFDNSAGASSVLSNPSTYGSSIDQIAKIATAAQFSWKKDGKKISIWQQNAPIDDTVIDLGPNTDPQMVGYPSWWDAGLIVQSLYNPQIQIARRMNVVGSSIPNANGLWKITLVQHELTTMLAKGPWFTSAQLIPIGSP